MIVVCFGVQIYTAIIKENTKAKTICNTETPRSTITRLIRFLDCVLHLLYGSAPPKIPSCGNGRKLRSCHIYAGTWEQRKYIFKQNRQKLQVFPFLSHLIMITFFMGNFFSKKLLPQKDKTPPKYKRPQPIHLTNVFPNTIQNFVVLKINLK